MTPPGQRAEADERARAAEDGLAGTHRCPTVAADAARAGGRPAVIPADVDDFDLRDFIHHPREVRAEHLDLTALTGLRQEVVDALAHALAVEESTLDLMRDLLVTPTHADAVVTAFLTTWAYEKYWLADALRAVLAGSELTPAPPPAPGVLTRLRAGGAERVRPTVDAIRTNLLGQDVVAAHMVTGLADTLATRLTFTRLAALEPALVPLARAAGHTTQRHVGFYTTQARERLASGAGARRQASRALRRWRWPGTAFTDRDQTARVLRFLLGGPTARVQVGQVDDYLGALPGVSAGAVLRTEFGRFVVRGTTAG